MEKDWKLLSPLGVADIMESDCALKSKTEKAIADAFGSFGYNEIQTPTFEYFNVFADDLSIRQENVMKFIDGSGKILALRPDYTTAISRVVATHKSSRDLPLRLRYCGNIFRSSESYTGARQKEFTQAGAELFGSCGAEADAEIIILTIDALKKAGLEQFQLELGHSGFLRGVIGDSLSEDELNDLTELLDKKFILGIEDFCKNNRIPAPTAQILCEMPNLYGGEEILRDMLQRELSGASRSALLNLLEVYSLVEAYGYGEYISVDLGLVRSFKYYTGIVFKGITHGVAFPICGGGRYDSLTKRFGCTLSATGTAIWTDRVMAAIVRQNGVPEAPKTDLLVWYSHKDARFGAYSLAKKERLSGKSVICEMHGFESDAQADEYARAHKIAAAVKAEAE